MRLSEHHARKLLQLVERNRSKVKQGEHVDPDIWARHQPPLQGLIYPTRTAARSHLLSGHLGAEPASLPPPLLSNHSFNDSTSDFQQLDADASSRLFREIGPSISVAHSLATAHPPPHKQPPEFIPPVLTLQTPPLAPTSPRSTSTSSAPPHQTDTTHNPTPVPPPPTLPPPPPPPPLPVETSVYRAGVTPPPPPTPPPPDALITVQTQHHSAVHHHVSDEEDDLESYDEFPASVHVDAIPAQDNPALHFGGEHEPRSGRRDSTLSSGYLSRSEYTGYSEDVALDEGHGGRLGKVHSLPDTVSDALGEKQRLSALGLEG